MGRRGERGQKATNEVGSDDGVERFGVVDHADGHRIDEHVVDGDIREVFRDLLDDLFERVERKEESQRRRTGGKKERRQRTSSQKTIPLR